MQRAALPHADAASGAGAAVAPAGAPAARRAPAWWPLLALTVLAAALRFSTIGLQSFWYDEAFTPVHVLHASLWATLRSVVHTENTPPAWYVLVWAVSRALGTGVVALRSLSALAGVATVPLAWEIGRELSGRRAAIGTAALVAVNPLFVWYSQEARAYELFAFAIALTIVCFLRAQAEPTGRRLAAFALAGALALLTHYFAVFLLIPMALWLLRRREHRGEALAAVAAIAAAGLALVPLIAAQGGHGTQWIGRWPLVERLEAIPQYYLTGTSGQPLGHGIQLLVALPILVGIGYGLWRGPTRAESDGALLMGALAACGVGIPLLLVAFGADYLAPRNLIGAMVPLTAFVAVLCTARRTGRAGMVLLGIAALGFLLITIDVNLSPRLQRGDWAGVARTLRTGAAGRSPAPVQARAIVTAELGAAPLEYYMPPLHSLRVGASARVTEIDEIGYAPLLPSAGVPPAPGFRLAQRRDVEGLIVYRFLSSRPQQIPEEALRSQRLTAGYTEVLVPG